MPKSKEISVDLTKKAVILRSVISLLFLSASWCLEQLQYMPLDCKVQGIEKKENQDDISKDNMKNSAASLTLGHSRVFQQRHDLKHTATLVQNFLKDIKIKVLPRHNSVDNLEGAQGYGPCLEST